MTPASGAPAQDEAGQHRLIAVTLDELSIGRGSSDQEHERAVAIYDLVEKNYFRPCGHDGGPYRLVLSLIEGRLVFTVSEEGGTETLAHHLSLTPFKRLIRDYAMLCSNYYDAIRTASPTQIEAIDMGRRGLHNEAAEVLQERLKDKIEVDFTTARRLFTLVFALQWRG